MSKIGHISVAKLAILWNFMLFDSRSFCANLPCSTTVAIFSSATRPHFLLNSCGWKKDITLHVFHLGEGNVQLATAYYREHFFFAMNVATHI